MWQVNTIDQENVYKSEYTKDSYSSQSCGGIAHLYSEDADGNYIEGNGGLKEDYWALKNKGSLKPQNPVSRINLKKIIDKYSRQNIPQF